MIVEGLVTTQNAQQAINVAPMGPIVQGDFESMILRPFAGSTTFQNLLDQRQGVFHVVDQVDLIAKAAIGRLIELPPMFSAETVQGSVLSECCRWFEFRITEVDTSDLRSEMQAEIVHRGERRPFYGFNRARHAVIEAAIMATRIHLLPPDDIRRQFDWLESAVHKTGGATELASFQHLREYVETAAAEVAR
ncbi:MAG: DUF447 family protein [Fuerstiella sp.]